MSEHARESILDANDGIVTAAVVSASPVGPRVELTIVAVLLALALTGWVTAWITGLSPLRLVRRNLVLGAATLAAGFLIGLVSGVNPS